MLEYHPEPWNKWLKVGDLQHGRSDHAILSFGPQQLPCMWGMNNDKKMAMTTSLAMTTSCRLVALCKHGKLEEDIIFEQCHMLEQGSQGCLGLGLHLHLSSKNDMIS